MADPIETARIALESAIADRDAGQAALDAARADLAAADPADPAAVAATQAAVDTAQATLADLEAAAADRQKEFDLASVAPPPAAFPAAPVAAKAVPVDLSTIAPTTTASTVAVQSAERVIDKVKVDINDNTRRNIAYILLLLLASVIVFHFTRSSELSAFCTTSLQAADLAANKSNCDVHLSAYTAVADKTQNVFTAIIGLVGSVVGFYFGSKSSQPPS